MSAAARRAWVAAGRAGVVVLVLLTWVATSQVTDLVPRVGPTWTTLVDGFRDGWLRDGLVATTQAVAVGFGWAVLLGFPLGYLLGRGRVLGELFDPLVAGLFAVPRIIFYPILLSWFGVGVLAESTMAALSALFPIAVMTTAAVREVARGPLPKLAGSLNLNEAQQLIKIYLPAIAPALMVALRIGFSVALIAAIIAEFFAARAGLGLLAARAYALLDLPRMFAVVLLILVIGFAGNLALWMAEQRLSPDRS
ncbi:MAG TPA: ABC transporter permease subunit [Micromonosporaceae bacterium]|nr:ABC transporter permease subunit [Micromonosporaceae bacterium]